MASWTKFSPFKCHGGAGAVCGSRRVTRHNLQLSAYRVYIRCFTYLHISINYPSRSLYKFCVRLIDWTPINYSKKNINKYCKINLLQKVINEIQMCSINNPLKIILKIIIAKIEKDIRLFFSSAKRHFRLHDWRCFCGTAIE